MFDKKKKPEEVKPLPVIDPPPEFPKKGSSGTGTDRAYTVEARFVHHYPKQAGKQVFDQRWQRVSFDTGYPGVPIGYMFDANAQRHGLMTYACVEAMRWWFLAALEAHEVCGSLCWETRIVSHDVKYSHSEEAINAFGIVTDGKRPPKQ